MVEADNGFTAYGARINYLHMRIKQESDFLKTNKMYEKPWAYLNTLDRMEIHELELKQMERRKRLGLLDGDLELDNQEACQFIKRFRKSLEKQ